MSRSGGFAADFAAFAAATAAADPTGGSVRLTPPAQVQSTVRERRLTAASITSDLLPSIDWGIGAGSATSKA